MRRFAVILLFLQLSLNAQDKLFFRDSSVQSAQVISVGRDKVYVRDGEAGAAYEIPRDRLLLIDQASGRKYIFAATAGSLTGVPQDIEEKRNMLGLHPLGFFFGRATLVYERLSNNGKVGFVLPFSITFNPFHSAYSALLDSSGADKLLDLSFIAGADINYYPGRKSNARFFIGPRLRYGTDILLQNMEAYTLQTQLGWRFGAPRGSIAQHLSFGFGFARILSTRLGPFPDPQHTFGWYSLSYRMSFRW